MEGRYRILGTLGEGGVGVVYKAHDTLLDKTVAIKKIQSKSSGKDVVRFQKEARVGGALVHPNILGVIDFGITKENDFYLVLNFIHGESLGELLKRTGPLPLLEAVDIFVQIANGLAHAHKNKVIHRDIKPSNVMLVDDSAGGINAQIVDFGLAKSLEQDQSLTKSGLGIGTPRYMSPEQIRGERDVGPATDVYSMGCLIFETLVGIPAFRGDNVMETLQKHLNDDIPDFNSVGDLKFPSRMVEIVNKCLQKDAADRFASGQELLEQLDQLLEYLQTSSLEPIDSARLLSKSGATISGDQADSSSASGAFSDSKTGAMLHGRGRVIGAIGLACIVCLLIAMQVVSILRAPGFIRVHTASNGYNSLLSKEAETDLDSSHQGKNLFRETNNTGPEQNIDRPTSNKSAKIISDEQPVLGEPTQLQLPGVPTEKQVPGVLADDAPVPPEKSGAFEYIVKSKKYWSIHATDDQLKKFVAVNGPKVHKMHFKRATVSPGGYAILKTCPLTFLEFENTPITADVLKTIGNLPDLVTVVLKDCTEIDFSHLRELNRLKQFHELVIKGAKLSKADVENIARVRNVDQLKLDNCTGLSRRENLMPLAALRKLGVLHMVASDFTDAGFEVVKQLPLGYLVISKAKITKYGLANYLRSGSRPIYIEYSSGDALTAREFEMLSKLRPNAQLIQVPSDLEAN